MIAWRDGEWIEDGDVLPADDRGLTLGDGLFETLLATDGALAHAALHKRARPWMGPRIGPRSKPRSGRP